MAGPALEDDLPVRLGEIVADKYRVDRLIGSGGMGSVVEAMHVQLLQRVAIKFVRADALDESSSIRLLREARAAVVLQSEHVARVVDVGALPSGIAYLVMEYLDGETLAARLSRTGPLPIGHAMWVASQACKGLGEAHRRGIIHRDVKPANLLLARQADSKITVKIVDFGIAKVLDPHVAVAPELTSSDHALGTPRYMSPEQLTASAHVDARTDVWALGVLLYECLVGETPFPRGTSFEVGARILAGAAPRISETLPAVPASLDAIVARCLSREASARFADANELLVALDGTGIEAQAIFDDGASNDATATKESARTSLGLGARDPSLPPTRIGPLAAPVQARTQRLDTPPPGTPAPIAPALPRVAERDPTEPLPIRSPLRWVALGGLAVVVTVGIVVSVRARAERSDPSTLVPVPVPVSAEEPSASPTVSTSPTSPSVIAAPLTSPTGETTTTADVPTSDKPQPRPTTRRPTARPAMSRPPNER